MAERIVLTTPETVPAVTEYRIARVFLDLDTPSIKLDLVSNTGTTFKYQVTDETVTSVLDALNTGVFVGNRKTLIGTLLELVTSTSTKTGTIEQTIDFGTGRG